MELGGFGRYVVRAVWCGLRPLNGFLGAVMGAVMVAGVTFGLAVPTVFYGPPWLGVMSSAVIVILVVLVGGFRLHLEDLRRTAANPVQTIQHLVRFRDTLAWSSRTQHLGSGTDLVATMTATLVNHSAVVAEVRIVRVDARNLSNGPMTPFRVLDRPANTFTLVPNGVLDVPISEHRISLETIGGYDAEMKMKVTFEYTYGVIAGATFTRREAKVWSKVGFDDGEVQVRDIEDVVDVPSADLVHVSTPGLS